MTRHVAILFVAVFLIIVLPNMVHQPTVVDHVVLRTRPLSSGLDLAAPPRVRVQASDSLAAARIEPESQFLSSSFAQVESTPPYHSVPDNENQDRRHPQMLATLSGSGIELVSRLGRRKSMRHESGRNKRDANVPRADGDANEPINGRVRRDRLGAV